MLKRVDVPGLRAVALQAADAFDSMLALFPLLHQRGGVALLRVALDALFVFIRNRDRRLGAGNLFFALDVPDDQQRGQQKKLSPAMMTRFASNDIMMCCLLFFLTSSDFYSCWINGEMKKHKRDVYCTHQSNNPFIHLLQPRPCAEWLASSKISGGARLKKTGT